MMFQVLDAIHARLHIAVQPHQKAVRRFFIAAVSDVAGTFDVLVMPKPNAVLAYSAVPKRQKFTLANIASLYFAHP